MRDICAILSGLVVAQDYRRGQQLVVNRNFADNADFFQVDLPDCGLHLPACLLEHAEGGVVAHSMPLGKPLRSPYIRIASWASTATCRDPVLPLA